MLGQAGVPAKGLHSQGPPCSSTVQLQGLSLVSFGLGPAQGSGHEMARSIWGPLGGGIFVNLPWGYISTCGGEGKSPPEHSGLRQLRKKVVNKKVIHHLEVVNNFSCSPPRFEIYTPLQPKVIHHLFVRVACLSMCQGGCQCVHHWLAGPHCHAHPMQDAGHRASRTCFVAWPVQDITNKTEIIHHKVLHHTTSSQLCRFALRIMSLTLQLHSCHFFPVAGSSDCCTYGPAPFSGVTHHLSPVHRSYFALLISMTAESISSCSPVSN